MKTRKLLSPVFILSVSLAMPMSTFAMPNLKEFDTNSDGQVSTAEAQAGLTALFAKIDTNTDSYLSLSEVQAWRESAQVEHFNTLDTDKSTNLSLAELQAETPKGPRHTISSNLFTLLDADKNSALSWEEFSVIEPGKGEILRHFADMDSDADSQISQTEFLTNKPGHHGHGSHGRPASTTDSAG